MALAPAHASLVPLLSQARIKQLLSTIAKRLSLLVLSVSRVQSGMMVLVVVAVVLVEGAVAAVLDGLEGVRHLAYGLRGALAVGQVER